MWRERRRKGEEEEETSTSLILLFIYEGKSEVKFWCRKREMVMVRRISYTHTSHVVFFLFFFLPYVVARLTCIVKRKGRKA